MVSVTRLTSVSSSHPLREGSNKGISSGIYIATVTAVVVLVTVVVIIAAILVCVLQQRRSKMAVDVQYTTKESVENPIYAGIRTLLCQQELCVFHVILACLAMCEIHIATPDFV